MKYPKLSLFGSILIASTAPSHGQVTAADYAGDWVFKKLAAPSTLTETYYNSQTQQTRQSNDSTDFAGENETLVDTFFSDDFEIESGDLNFASNGSFTGFATGSFTLGLDNRFNISVPDAGGTQIIPGYSNLSRDFLILPGRNRSNPEFQIVSRKPATLGTADLQGAWQVHTIEVPSDLMESYFHTVNLTSRQALATPNFAGTNEVLADTFFSTAFGSLNFAINIAANGTVTGDIQGSMSANGDRTVSLDLGDEVIPFSINRGINVMNAVKSNGDSFEIIIAVKCPSTTPLVSNAAGTWRLQSLIVPKDLTETYYNTETQQTRQSTNSTDFAGTNERLVDTFFPNNISSENRLISIDSSGNIIGTDAGTLTASNLNYIYSPNDSVEMINFHPNPTGDIMIARIEDDDEFELITMIKVSSDTPTTFIELVKFTPTIQPDKIDLQWNEADGICLTKSSTLGNWTEVGGTDGAGGHSITFDESKAFFRVEIPQD